MKRLLLLILLMPSLLFAQGQKILEHDCVFEAKRPADVLLDKLPTDRAPRPEIGTKGKCVHIGKIDIRSGYVLFEPEGANRRYRVLRSEITSKSPISVRKEER